MHVGIRFQLTFVTLTSSRTAPMHAPIKKLNLSREILRSLRVSAGLRAGGVESSPRFNEDPETAPILKSRVLRDDDNDAGG